jgi:hypothetical protein
MHDVAQAHGGSGCNDHDWFQVEGEAEEDQQDSRAHGPQDRMDQDPAAEAVRHGVHARQPRRGRHRAGPSHRHDGVVSVAGQLVLGLDVVDVFAHHGESSQYGHRNGGYVIDDVRSAITA